LPPSRRTAPHAAATLLDRHQLLAVVRVRRFKYAAQHVIEPVPGCEGLPKRIFEPQPPRSNRRRVLPRCRALVSTQSRLHRALTMAALRPASVRALIDVNRELAAQQQSREQARAPSPNPGRQAGAGAIRLRDDIRSALLVYGSGQGIKHDAACATTATTEEISWP
jgi:hypothetical protein